LTLNHACATLSTNQEKEEMRQEEKNPEQIAPSVEKFIELMKKKATKKMSREELERHVTGFIESHNMCVLATSRDDVPRATPIEYHSRGTTLYMMGEPGIKIGNIKANPQVSVGIHDPLGGDWLSTTGIQITGTAEILTWGSPEAYEALEVCHLEAMAGQISNNGTTLIRIEAKKIELMELGLKMKDYAPHQVWEAE